MSRATLHEIVAPVALVLAMLAMISVLAWCTAGCAPSTQRPVCVAAGGTLSTVAALLQERLTDELVAAPDDAARDAVDERWAPVLAAYETVAAAQNAWAGALEAGETYPIGAVQAAWCTARPLLVAEGVSFPDWPIGGCAP